jgi:hypothetical protein
MAVKKGFMGKIDWGTVIGWVLIIITILLLLRLIKVI